MENVNKQLLDAMKSIRHSMRQGRIIGNDYRREMKHSEELATEAIAAAEQAQQAEPVAWLYEMAIGIDADGNPIEWSPHVQMVKPSALYHTRNIRPLIHGDAAQPPAVAVPANQQMLAEVVALLESHQKWINKLPVPTTGATHQMMQVVGKAIDILGSIKSAVAVPETKEASHGA